MVILDSLGRNSCIDTVLPFVLQSSHKRFNSVADAEEWIVCQQRVSKVFHYLDGFLIVGNPHARDCTVQLSVLRKVFEYLGIPVAMEKLEGPVGLSLLYF